MIRCRSWLPAVALLALGLALTACKKRAGHALRHAASTGPNPSAAPAGLSPQQIVDKAIQAYGGLAGLQRTLASVTYETSGNQMGQPFTTTTYWKAPNQMVIELHEMQMTLAHIGDECWGQIRDMVAPCGQDRALAAKQVLAIAHLSNLYPLKEEGTRLEPAAGTTINNRPALAVHATLKNSDVRATLYIDPKDGRLLRISYQGTWNGRPAQIEINKEDQRTVAGLSLPHKSTTTINGQVAMVEQIMAIKPGPIDEAKLKRPRSVPGRVRVHDFPKYTAAYSTHRGPYAQIGTTINKLYGWIAQKELQSMGPPIMAFVKIGKQPEDAVTEVRAPVTSTSTGAMQEDEFGLKPIEGTQMAVSVEQGPFDEVARRFGPIMGWARKQRYTISGPPMMISYSDPRTTEPGKLMHELCIPVRKR